jgi:hypothetical protein
MECQAVNEVLANINIEFQGRRYNVELTRSPSGQSVRPIERAPHNSMER